jgi:hypothetical protein
VRFYDTNSVLGNLTQHQLLANGDQRTIRNTGYYGGSAFVIRGYNAIFIQPNFWGGTESRPRREQDAILVHELLHVVFPIGEGIRNSLQIPGRFGPEDSPAITDWLLADCPRT